MSMILLVTGSKMKVANATFMPTSDELTIVQTYGMKTAVAVFI
jgi:hypothetical protein